MLVEGEHGRGVKVNGFRHAALTHEMRSKILTMNARHIVGQNWRRPSPVRPNQGLFYKLDGPLGERID